MVWEEKRISTNPTSIKRRRSVASIYLKYPKCLENIVNYQQHDGGDASMPEKTHQEMKDANHNVEKEPKDNKQNYQTCDNPYP